MTSKFTNTAKGRFDYVAGHSEARDWLGRRRRPVCLLVLDNGQNRNLLGTLAGPAASAVTT